MILNGLGYTDRPLYLVAEILKTMNVEKLFGPEKKPEDLTNDVLGGTLDKIYAADHTGLFIKLVNQTKPAITRRKRDPTSIPPPENLCLKPTLVGVLSKFLGFDKKGVEQVDLKTDTNQKY